MDRMEGSPSYFVGIDWASDKHDACVLDTDGTRRAAFVIGHTADGSTWIPLPSLHTNLGSQVHAELCSGITCIT